MNTNFLLALAVGLLSAPHCVSMCGGIVGALSFSLPVSVREQPARLGAFLFAYNLGRILSYAGAGALFGWFGALMLDMSAHAWAYDGLRVLAAVIVVGIGLSIGGWLPRMAALERLGAPLWQRIEPWGRRLLPVRTLPQAMLFGAIWGWLPCGLVYGMLISVPAQGSAAAGAVYLALFGVGTLLPLLTTGFLAGSLYRLGQDRRFKMMAGLMVIALGLVTLHFQGYNAGN
ncbi:sulfite exporter TauE/SafE family protein [uncultured Lamprocystis sp.]|jgi:sulfite exporter TauE/SafE|uniref:sulfite exporter TauE/SafE family protein n=1 Tax=uncultured Lamprocystis sp. TaxID=543132 RepID=UPI0025F6FE36|nr:sulfite exporter TauE/SafE family protein [uncultured Lamprocystis sp.]